MARIASTYSAMRGAGCTQGTLKRRSLCARTWVPSPSTNRPCDCAFRSQACWAVIIGLRGKEIATDVASCSRSVASAAIASGANGSLASSGQVSPSNPSASAAAAAGPMARQSL